MRPSTGLVLAVALLVPVRAAARAEGGAMKGVAKGGVFPEATEATDDEAKKMLADLKAVAAEKDDKKVADAVSPMVLKKHKDFVPELKRLLADRRDRVSAEAACALGSQGDKTVGPLLIKVLNAKTRDREGFLRDPDTKAAAAEALGRLGEEKAVDPILEIAREMRGGKEVAAAYARRVVKGCVRALGLLKAKEAVSYLIDEVEQPAPKDPNAASNPGVDYWKYRFDIWTEIKAEVTWALKEITGKEFESLKRWENWFKEEGRKAGMK